MPASQQAVEHAVQRAGKIFAILRQYAETGEACPANQTLAERFGVSSQRISAALDFLECNGMITVERGSNHRVVTICSTGKRTSGVVKIPHWSRRAA